MSLCQLAFHFTCRDFQPSGGFNRLLLLAVESRRLMGWLLANGELNNKRWRRILGSLTDVVNWSKSGALNSCGYRSMTWSSSRWTRICSKLRRGSSFWPSFSEFWRLPLFSLLFYVSGGFCVVAFGQPVFSRPTTALKCIVFTVQNRDRCAAMNIFVVTGFTLTGKAT